MRSSTSVSGSCCRATSWRPSRRWSRSACPRASATRCALCRLFYWAVLGEEGSPRRRGRALRHATQHKAARTTNAQRVFAQTKTATFGRRPQPPPTSPSQPHHRNPNHHHHINPMTHQQGLMFPGFMYLHTLFLTRGRLESTWTVLKTFGERGIAGKRMRRRGGDAARERLEGEGSALKPPTNARSRPQTGTNQPNPKTETIQTTMIQNSKFKNFQNLNQATTTSCASPTPCSRASPPPAPTRAWSSPPPL